MSKRLETPESDVEALISFHEILDEDDLEDPRFTVIFTTKKLVAQINDKVSQGIEWFSKNVLKYVQKRRKILKNKNK